MKLFGGRVKQPMPAVEALNQELERIHQDLKNFTFNPPYLENDPTMEAFREMLAQRHRIQEVLIDLAKGAK